MPYPFLSRLVNIVFSRISSGRRRLFDGLRSFILRLRLVCHDIVVLIKKRGGRTGSLIAIHYVYPYQADYLKPVVCQNPRFVFRRSEFCIRADEKEPLFKWSDPSTLDVVITDKIDLLSEGFSRYHRLLLRMQHSPGFGFYVPIYLYPEIKKQGGKLMIAEIVWQLMQKSSCLDPVTESVRRMILRDGTPLLFTRFDPKLNLIYNYPVRSPREPGTVLIALSWRIEQNQENVGLLSKAVDFLSKKFKVKVMFHPINDVRHFLHKPVLRAIKKYLDERGIETMLGLFSTMELTSLYDQNEFIVTDGSGSAYEAIARGCKALSLYGFDYHTNCGVLHPAVELGLLPQTAVWDYRDHPGTEKEFEWLKTFYERSLVREDVSPYVAREICDAFDSW